MYGSQPDPCPISSIRCTNNPIIYIDPSGHWFLGSFGHFIDNVFLPIYHPIGVFLNSIGVDFSAGAGAGAGNDANPTVNEPPPDNIGPAGDIGSGNGAPGSAGSGSGGYVSSGNGSGYSGFDSYDNGSMDGYGSTYLTIYSEISPGTYVYVTPSGEAGEIVDPSTQGSATGHSQSPTPKTYDNINIGLSGASSVISFGAIANPELEPVADLVTVVNAGYSSYKYLRGGISGKEYGFELITDFASVLGPRIAGKIIGRFDPEMVEGVKGVFHVADHQLGLGEVLKGTIYDPNQRQ